MGSALLAARAIANAERLILGLNSELECLTQGLWSEFRPHFSGCGADMQLNLDPWQKSRGVSALEYGHGPGGQHSDNAADKGFGFLATIPRRSNPQTFCSYTRDIVILTQAIIPKEFDHMPETTWWQVTAQNSSFMMRETSGSLLKAVNPAPKEQTSPFGPMKDW